MSRRIRSNKLHGLISFLLFFAALSFVKNVDAQESEKNLLVRLMKEKGEVFQHILTDREKYRVQILYTQIDRNEKNEPHFTSFSYGVPEDTYFYPASTVKIFGAALSLEKFNNLNIKNLNKESYVAIDSSFSGQTAVLEDTTSASGKPSMGHYIKKLLIVSDNDAYNRTYEFLGQKALNENLRNKGYDRMRLTHRLSISLSPEENRNTSAMQFYSEDPNRPIYRQASMSNTTDFTADSTIFLGERYVSGDSIIDEPMDFSKKNYCSVEELQRVIKSLIFPESLSKEFRFDLSRENLNFLRTYMSQLPRETDYPNYRALPDNYCKFFIYGDDDLATIPEHIRIFNKIGLAYGFCIDNAYIVDFNENIEFMLTAVIYANENNTLNDGIYEYETVAFPFLAELGRIIYNYELKRPRSHEPNLKEFQLLYDDARTQKSE